MFPYHGALGPCPFAHVQGQHGLMSTPATFASQAAWVGRAEEAPRCSRAHRSLPETHILMQLVDDTVTRPPQHRQSPPCLPLQRGEGWGVRGGERRGGGLTVCWIKRMDEPRFWGITLFTPFTHFEALPVPRDKLEITCFTVLMWKQNDAPVKHLSTSISNIYWSWSRPLLPSEWAVCNWTCLKGAHRLLGSPDRFLLPFS